jgi:hypothetical protein
MPVLIALRFEIPQSSVDDEERAYLMSTTDLYEQWERQTKAESLKQGLKQGQKQSLIDAYCARFGALPPEIAAAIETTNDTSVLKVWLVRIVTGTPEEIAATLRSRSTPPT